MYKFLRRHGATLGLLGFFALLWSLAWDANVKLAESKTDLAAARRAAKRGVQYVRDHDRDEKHLFELVRVKTEIETAGQIAENFIAHAAKRVNGS